MEDATFARLPQGLHGRNPAPSPPMFSTAQPPVGFGRPPELPFALSNPRLMQSSSSDSEVR